MSAKERLIHGIIKFLSSEAASDATNEEAKESIEVAKQCLETAYGIDPNERPELDVGVSLEELVAKCAPPPRKPLTEEDKKRAEALKLEGNEHMKQSRFQEAVDSYTKAIEVDQTNAIYYSNRAAAFNKLNRFHEAVDDCDDAIALDPNYSKAFGRKGLALAGLNLHADAIANYKKAIELDPSNENFKTNLEIAQEKAASAGNTGGVGAGLGSLLGGGGGMPDMAALMNNPAMMQMAAEMMQSPGMQQMMNNFVSSMQPGAAPDSTSSDTPPAPGEQAAPNMEHLMRAGQQFAEQMQRTNPDLVNQLRNRFQGDMGGGGTNPDGGNNPQS